MKKGAWVKRTLIAVLSTAFVLTAAGCGAPSSGGGSQSADSGEPIILKFSHVTTAESPKGKAAEKFAELAAQKTNNRVKVEVFPSSQLYGDKDEMDALQANNVQMVAPSVTKLVGFVPSFQIVDLPFLFNGREAVLQFWDGDLGKKLMSSLEPQGILGLAMWENGFKNFTNNKHPLKRPEDFNGLKFRTQAGKVLEAQFTALGAGAATIPFGETYTALQQGTVDGQENTFNNIDTQKYAEVQKYLTVSQHGRLDYVVLVNKSFWDGLPEDIRKALEEAMKEATEYERQLAAELDQQSFENLKKAGMEVTELTPEDRAAFQKAFEPVYTEFAEVIGQEYIDGVKALK
ncbi:TRAP transporter substrate-binding protein [Brevibacillus humidisoli]|uniref:TRAP transporter substrate-binding protein n=1 Tax=Brevibacillus humidisoli TaxID=2895522 RepID=UPI001E5071FF|nr:TRAP transporter substrate-binding protein [Brevibacillus humidisoli]UFJ38905.1 TRAP transporter substrate-binding protein [Brevibacillus humidisoli]